ncbi:MAG: hypothetical protein AAF468_00765 [Pseudomonadota bacterium]
MLSAIKSRLIGYFEQNWTAIPILILIGASGWRWSIYWFIALWMAFSSWLLIATQLGFGFFQNVEQAEISEKLQYASIIVLMISIGALIRTRITDRWLFPVGGQHSPYPR